MRLIDADDLRKEIHMSYSDDLGIREVIDKQPTAFDLKSVIEQLENLKTYKLNMADAMSELMNKEKLGNYVCLEDVLEILKSSENAANWKKGGWGNGRIEEMSEMRKEKYKN